MRASVGPGSTPSSSTRQVRARLPAASASACRSLRYSASISRIHQPSRSGSAAIRASSSATSSRCRPRSRSTSIRASRIDACTSARRRRSPSAQPAVRQSSKGSPRQYARAASNPCRAASRSPAAWAARPVDAATAAAPASTDSGLTASAYASPRLATNCPGEPGGRSGSRLLRRRTTCACSDLRAVGGGRPDQTSSTSTSTGTARPGQTSNLPRTARSFAPGTATPTGGSPSSTTRDPRTRRNTSQG